MDLMKKHISILAHNTESTIEKKLATELNNYSVDNHISYSLEITDDNDTSINILDLEKSMNKKLNVNIKVGEVTGTWIPIDNKNIYLLLRE
ncbi:MAG: hypothetical protein OQK75_11800 [Gammaproteobacteria bacterium]|nr:hypothetical protein [Gammaproteobacteria bacterium]MCW8988339.1 hypothetical protein [Gammaproteobacteria bacterium]